MARRRVRAALLVAFLGAPFCWTPLMRRNVLVGSLLTSSPAMAEEMMYQTTTPTGDPYLERVQSRTGDFSIQLPVPWQKDFDNYPGRLILSVDPEELAKLQGGNANDAVTVRCARLALPALLRSAQYQPRAGDEARSDWKEVALGDVNGGNVAEWLMRAGQAALASQVGVQLPQIDIKMVDFDIKEGPRSEQSILTWHAITTVQPSSGNEVQGLGGKSVVPLSSVFSQAPTPAGEVPPLSAFGQAILSKGQVTFAIAQAPVNRLEENYSGKTGKKYLDYIIQSLKLT